MKLDLKDKKILSLLDENARYSNAQIARKVGLSKPAVEYRIKRLENNDVIFSYYAVVDFAKLGYSLYKLYFKFQDVSLEKENEIISHWTASKNSVWVARIRGIGDIAVTLFAKSNFEFGAVLDDFMNKYSKFILDKEVFLSSAFSIYSREYLSEAKPSEFNYSPPEKIYELADSDRKILKELSVNARISILELAKKTSLTRDIVSYRMKKLVKDKVITHFRCYLKLNNLNIKHYKVFFRTVNCDARSEKKLVSYVQRHKKATQYLKLIGSWDFEIEFETESEDELYTNLNELRKEFSSIIRDFDIIRIIKTEKYNYFPF